jgi:hypothetical protein
MSTYGQLVVNSVASDSIYPSMTADSITLYINILSPEVIKGTDTIDADSTVTLYTGLITLASGDYSSGWQHVANSAWDDLSYEMTKENDSVFSYTIHDPATFYGVDPEVEPVFRVAFIARGTSNGSIDKQTNDLFVEVFDTVTMDIVRTIPEEPYSTDKLVMDFNTQACPALVGYTDTLYAHTGLYTTVSGTDWHFIIAEWGVNDAKSRLIQVSDSIYRFVEFPSIHQFYATGNAENIDSIALILRTKEEPFAQSENIYIPVTDTVTILDGIISNTASTIVNAYPNPVSDEFIIDLGIKIDGAVTFCLYTAEGKRIYEDNLTPDNNQELRLKAQDLFMTDNGLYFYTIAGNNYSARGKLLFMK